MEVVPSHEDLRRSGWLYLGNMCKVSVQLIRVSPMLDAISYISIDIAII